VRAVALLLDSVSQLGRWDRTAFVTVPLMANLGQTRLKVGMSSQRPQDAPFDLTIGDSLDQNGWSVSASARHLRELLTVIDATAQTSVFDSLPRATDVVYVVCQLDRPPRRRDGATPRYPMEAEQSGREGRVLAEFVVDSSGVVRSETFRTLLSDGQEFSQAVRKAVLRAAFVPGTAKGHAVSTLVWQWFAFRMHR
jgi:TonB family protein